MFMDMSEINMVTTSFVALILISLVCCMCCICIRRSDQKLMHYVCDQAKKKGVKLKPADIYGPNKECPCGCENDVGANIAIFIPEVGVVM